MPTTGLAYPLQINGSGGLKLSSDSDNCRDHIVSWLETQTGERLGLPDYGTPDFLLNSYQSFSAVAVEINLRLSNAVPEAQIAVSGDIDGNGQGLITVEWIYRGSSQPAITLSMDLPTSYPPAITDSGNIAYLPKLLWLDVSQENFDTGRSVNTLKDFARPGVTWTSSTGTFPIASVDNSGRKIITSNTASRAYSASSPAVFQPSSPFLIWSVANISSVSSYFGRPTPEQHFVYRNQPYWKFTPSRDTAWSTTATLLDLWVALLICRELDNSLTLWVNGVTVPYFNNVASVGAFPEECVISLFNGVYGNPVSGKIAEFGGMVGSFSNSQKTVFTNFLRQKWSF
jgi:hypothetical protein